MKFKVGSRSLSIGCTLLVGLFAFAGFCLNSSEKPKELLDLEAQIPPVISTLACFNSARCLAVLSDERGAGVVYFNVPAEAQKLWTAQAPGEEQYIKWRKVESFFNKTSTWDFDSNVQQSDSVFIAGLSAILDHVQSPVFAAEVNYELGSSSP